MLEEYAEVETTVTAEARALVELNAEHMSATLRCA